MNHVIRERRQLTVFIVVGGTSFGIYIGTYALFSRVLFTAVPREWLNIAAVLVAVAFNFIAHRNWTYKAKEATGVALAGQAFRYTLVVASSTALNALLFWFGHRILGVYDIFVAVAAAGICAIYSYIAHRMYSFRVNP